MVHPIHEINLAHRLKIIGLILIRNLHLFNSGNVGWVVADVIKNGSQFINAGFVIEFQLFLGDLNGTIITIMIFLDRGEQSLSRMQSPISPHLFPFRDAYQIFPFFIGEKVHHIDGETLPFNLLRRGIENFIFLLDDPQITPKPCLADNRVDGCRYRLHSLPIITIAQYSYDYHLGCTIQFQLFRGEGTACQKQISWTNGALP